MVEALPPGLRTIDVVNLSIEAMQSLLTRYRLASNPPDVLITAPVDACGTLDFHLAADMIQPGRDLAIDALDRAELQGHAQAAPDRPRGDPRQDRWRRRQGRVKTAGSRTARGLS